ncbi:hypothetical protein [Spirosoma agri]|nr:hypothetical protein [Spirosoma agri]
MSTRNPVSGRPDRHEPLMRLPLRAVRPGCFVMMDSKASQRMINA